MRDFVEDYFGPIIIFLLVAGYLGVCALVIINGSVKTREVETTEDGDYIICEYNRKGEELSCIKIPHKKHSL